MTKRWVFQFALPVLLILAGIAVTSKDQKQTTNQGSNRSDESRFPIADYAAAESNDPLERTKRRARGRKRDRSDWSVNPDVASDTTVLVDTVVRTLPAFPIDQSKAIVIGEVMDGKAFLSNDKTGVYSVFTVRIKETLSNRSDVMFTNGASIEAEREGGRVKFPSGRLHLFLTKEQRMPKVGARYLLFLSAENGDGVFQIVTGYQLHNGKVFPLDNLSKPKSYLGADETAFLSELKSKISKKEVSADYGGAEQEFRPKTDRFK